MGPTRSRDLEGPVKRAWQAMSGTFFLFAVFVFLNSFEYPFFDRLGPGPGFFPAWLSGVAAALALVLLAQVSLGKANLPGDEGLIPSSQAAVRILLVLGSLSAVLLMLNPLGFRLSMLVFLCLLPLTLGIRNYLATGLLALAGSFGVFHLFYFVLKLPLPLGAFDDLLSNLLRT